MKHKKYLLILIIVVINNIFYSCETKKTDDSGFIVIDYNPDIEVRKGDTVYFDINQDGENDFMALHIVHSNFTYLTFESVNSNCQLSDGLGQLDRSFLLIGDTINENLTWKNTVFWIVGTASIDNGNAYLAIKTVNNTVSNYGWLLPKIGGTNSGNHYLIIEKTSYCKINNLEIIAGQEKFDE
jgi:hypothetical protein